MNGDPPQAVTGNAWRTAALLSFSALDIALHAVLFLRYPHMFFLGYDDKGYVVTAQNIVLHHMIKFLGDTRPSVFVMPGYPVFIAIFYWIFGVHPFALDVARAVQLGLMIAAAYLVYRLALRYFGPLTALLTFGLLLFIPGYFFTPLFLYSESLFIFLAVVDFSLSLRFYEHPTVRNMAYFGVALGVTLLTRPTIALFPVAFMIFLWLRRVVNFAGFVRLSLIGAVISLAFLVPWWIRNYHDYHKFIPLSAETGNPLLYGSFPIAYSWNLWSGEPTRIVLTPRERGLFRTHCPSLYVRNEMDLQEAYKNIAYEWRKNPLRFILSYTVGKFINFYTPMFWIKYNAVATGIQRLLHWTLMLLIALGLVFSPRSRYKTWVLLYTASTQIVYQVYLSMARYSLPVILFMVPFAVWSLLSAWERVFGRAAPGRGGPEPGGQTG